jgi:hypothetical protein
MTTVRLTPMQVTRMCASKRICTPTRAEAKRRARALRGLLNRKFRPYRCDVCGLWHLTSVKGGA